MSETHVELTMPVLNRLMGDNDTVDWLRKEVRRLVAAHVENELTKMMQPSIEELRRQSGEIVAKQLSGMIAKEVRHQVEGLKPYLSAIIKEEINGT